MILDTLANAERYYAVHPLFRRALEFLKTRDFMSIPPGRIELEGADLYAMISVSHGKAPGEAVLETHRKYIDIQYLVSGEESMGWRDAGECRVIQQEYAPDKDIAFFADRPSFWLTAHPGTFVVFFPEDAHAPLVGTGNIRKVIVKIAL
jgi:biofilm protein TabA